MNDTSPVEPETFGITIEPTYIGQRRDDRGWEHFLWHITLRREDAHNGRRQIDTQFRMGLAHVTAGRYGRPDKPNTPTLIDVLSSLQSDARVDEDDEYDEILHDVTPYSNARRLHAAIRESADKVRTLLGREFAPFLEVEYDP